MAIQTLVGTIERVTLSRQNDALLIEGEASVPKLGYKNRQLVLHNPLAQGDVLELDFVAEQPEMGGDQINTISAFFVLSSIPEGMNGVRVYGASNHVTTHLSHSATKALFIYSGGGVGDPFPRLFAGGDNPFPRRAKA